jgi:flagellar motility protein MotE (MotC chaperone)
MTAVRKQLEENLATLRECTRQSADDMAIANERMKKLNERIDRHLERLAEGEDEVTPPPFMLPLTASRK